MRDLDTRSDEFWYASQVAEMSLGCRARLFAKNWVREHKLTLAGAPLLLSPACLRARAALTPSPLLGT